MLALQAHVRLVGPQGERLMPIHDLYRDDGVRYLAKRPDEILTHILLPPADGWRMQYFKLRRREAFDFPILGVAAAVRLAADGTCTEARLVLGAVTSTPLVAAAAAAVLIGQQLTPEVIEAAAAAAFKPAKPLDNTDLLLSYRKKMVRVHVARTLQKLADMHAPSA
jgi:CO/xanthine dehydrogenase FAD-binding subunit